MKITNRQKRPNKVYIYEYFICRPCAVLGETKYRATKNGRLKRQAISRQMQKKYPEKFRARNALARAVRSGKIIKPTECSKCFESKPKIEGHHADHSKPLEVVWLCTSCHADEERIKNKMV